MREKYESLSLVVLKDLAKARGIKGVSAMKKSELIDRMLQEDDEEKNSYITWDDNVCINVCDWEDMFLQPVQKPFGSGFNLLKKIDGFEVNNLTCNSNELKINELTNILNNTIKNVRRI